jgi:hypothetical protein
MAGLAAIPIVSILGAIGSGLALGLPWLMSSTTTDASSSLFAKATARLGQTIGVTSGRINTEEEGMIEDINKKYGDIERFLRIAVYTEAMVKEHIPDAIVKRSNGNIVDVKDVAKNIDYIKSDPELNNLIFEKFIGFFQYGESYKRILGNFYNLFERIRKLKEQINKIYEEQSSKNYLSQKYQETDENMKKLVGVELPKFIRSEMALLYEDFISAYSDYNQYKDRMGNMYRLIQKGGYDNLDIFEIARTDISKITGRKEGPLLRTTDQVVTAAEIILDSITNNRITYLICLKQIATTIDTWQSKFKTNKGVVVSSMKPILDTEKKQIEVLIGDHTSNISDLTSIQTALQEYKRDDKLDDARIKHELLKSKEKRMNDLKEQIKLFNGRMKSYVDTVNTSGEDKISFTPCNLETTTSTPSNSVPSSSGISAVTPSASSTSSASSEVARAGRPSKSDPIISSLNNINFAGATDKATADSAIEDFENVLTKMIPSKIESIKRDYQLAINLSQMMRNNEKIFGNESLYGTIDKSYFKTMQDIVK